MFLKRYKKAVAERKGFVFFAFLVAFAIRLVYYIQNEAVYTTGTFTSNFLWDATADIFAGSAISILTSSLSVIAIALLANHISTKHVLIRKRTSLPIAFVLLAYSFSPQFMGMSVHYISVIVVLLVTSSLFGSYNKHYKQSGAFSATFILVLGSFFDVSLLIYLPMLWIALFIMRIFSIKALFASIICILLMYAPVYSYFLLTDQLTAFYAPFITLVDNISLHLHFDDFTIFSWLRFGLSTLLVFIVFVNTYMDSFKDKIRTRSYFALLGIFLIYALVVNFFIVANPQSVRYIALGVSSLILAHFFALAEAKWKIYLFIIYLLLYFVLCYSNFYTSF